jgi:hypothetical protein
LRRGAIGGSAFVLSASTVAALAGRAAAATLPDNDLAYLRILIGAELLAADYQGKALASGKLSRTSTPAFRKMAADEQAHYAGLAQVMTAAGQTPATDGDIGFLYPRGSFASEASIVKLAAEIESIVLGTYLGAVGGIQTAELRLPVGQIAANEAQHVGAVSALAGRPIIGRAFAPSLTIDAASAALDKFES